MKIDLFFTPNAMEGAHVADRTVVVIDVIRATSTMTVALANGARAIYPACSAEEAIRLASSLGREDCLLCGERRGLKVEGFDLGNSPYEFTADRVRGKKLVMSTTNGTRAFLAAEGAAKVVAMSFLNLTAVADSVGGGEELVVICAGKEGRFSLDDAVCAGHLLTKLAGVRDTGAGLDDGARAAIRFAHAFEPDEPFLRSTAAGMALLDVGLEGDLSICAQGDLHPLVLEMEDRAIRAV